MKWLLAGLLTLLFLIFVLNPAQKWVERTYFSQEVAQPVEQVFAGDPLPVAERKANPVLYYCSDSTAGVFLVISPSSGEFMMFDDRGAWVNSGRFFEARTDEGIDYLHAEIGSNLLGFFRSNGSWHLAISTQSGASDLSCK